MLELTLDELVANRTLSPEMAETLAAAARERRGLVVAAVPQRAGKTTVLEAVLEASGAALHRLSLNHGPGLGIPSGDPDGYLVLAEIARTPFADYLWGEPVRSAFEATRRGWPVAATLHSDGIEGAFEQIVLGCGVSDADAAAVELFVYIRTFGPRFEPTRRVVERIYEVNAVEQGRPVARLLHLWDAGADRFEVIAEPQRIGRGVARPRAT